jgi:hypothetical protein
MSARWYCLIKDREHGPFSSRQIQRLAETGKLKPEHSVRPETDSHWTPAAEIPGLFPSQSRPAAPPVAKVAPASSARQGAADDPTAPLPIAQPITEDSEHAARVPPATVVRDTPSVTPVAKPIAAPTVQTAVTPIATPIAVPVAATAPTGAKAVLLEPPPAPPAAKSASHRYTHRGRHKSQTVTIVVGGLLGVLAALVVVGIMVFTRKPPADQPQTAAAPNVAGGDAAAEPAARDPESDPYADRQAPEAQGAGPPARTLPAVGRWLDATRQKGGLRDVAKLGVSDAWTEKTASGKRVLNIRVQITNLASDASLDFRGWYRSPNQAAATQALLADDQGKVLEPVPSEKSPPGSGATARRIKPDQTHDVQLTFAINDSTSGSYRLVLPYAALGHTGHLGFEIPVLMIQDHPPGEEPAEDVQAPGAMEPGAQPGAVPAASSGDAATPAADAGQRENEPGAAEQTPAPIGAGDQPATIKDLLRSIEHQPADPPDKPEP